jgi:hypothetical protein
MCALLIASEAAAGMCLDVSLTFAGRDPSALTVQSMESEASAIWQRYGVQLQWPASRNDSQCPRAHGTFDVLVRHQGSSAENASRSSVLGSTHLAPAAIDHAGIFVDYDATQQLLESLSASRLIPLVGHPDIGPADIGRALGRVLAHEIGHVLLDAPRHQQWGLMRRSFTPGRSGGASAMVVHVVQEGSRAPRRPRARAR